MHFRLWAPFFGVLLVLAILLYQNAKPAQSIIGLTEEHHPMLEKQEGTPTHRPPTKPSKAQPVARNVSFWHYIGVTCEASSDRAVNTANTWASRVPITWYGEGKLPDSLHVVQVEDETYLEALKKGAGYKFMTFKMRWIWTHAANHLLDKANWFIRHWDDNYVHTHALEEELTKHPHNESVLVAAAPYATGGGYMFPDGGSGWCLSNAGLARWNSYVLPCLLALNATTARAMLGPETMFWPACKDLANPGLWCAEDVFIWHCMKESGIRLIPLPASNGILQTSDSRVLVRHPVSIIEQNRLWQAEQTRKN